MKQEIGVSGNAAADEVWNRYIHPQRWSEWSPQISSVDCTDATIQPGSTGTVHGPCGISVNFEILQVDHEKRCWSFRVKVAMVTLTLVHGVEEAVPAASDDTTDSADSVGAAGSRTWLEIDGPAPVVIGYLPIARIALGRLVRR